MNLISGAGLGLRRDFAEEVLSMSPALSVDFYEVAPENWMRFGGSLGKLFRALTEKFPFVFHGLSLSLGGSAPLNEPFLRELKRFLMEHNVAIYSEHLSYCGDDGLLYDLMPIPFTEDAVKYVGERIRRVQDILEVKIAVENISYYAAPGKEMEEIDFLNAVLEYADCGLLLDINNVYVNSVNHCYDPLAFLDKIPSKRIVYAHIAGHYRESPSLLIDTHGASIVDPVWNLFSYACNKFGEFPTLLERDFHIPPLSELMLEIGMIREIQPRHRVG